MIGWVCRWVPLSFCGCGGIRLGWGFLFFDDEVSKLSVMWGKST